MNYNAEDKEALDKCVCEIAIQASELKRVQEAQLKLYAHYSEIKAQVTQDMINQGNAHRRLAARVWDLEQVEKHNEAAQPMLCELEKQLDALEGMKLSDKQSYFLDDCIKQAMEISDAD